MIKKLKNRCKIEKCFKKEYFQNLCYEHYFEDKRNIRNKSKHKIRRSHMKKKKKYKQLSWLRMLSRAKHRCSKYNTTNYHRYGGRGIKCFINSDEIKKLWFKYNAFKMKEPSLDRINNNKNYTLENCRIIERKENCRLGTIFARDNNLINTKLNKLKVISIRLLYKTKKYTFLQIANGFNVSYDTIRNVILRKSWKDF